MGNFITARPVRGLLFICLSLTLTYQISGKGESNFLSNGLNLALDLIGGLDLLAGVFQQDDFQKLQELSDKLDRLQDTVNSILTYVKTFVEEIDLQNRFKSFDEVKGVIQDLVIYFGRYINAVEEEKEQYKQEFLDQVDNNVRALRRLADVMFGIPSGQTESLFQILVGRNRCSYQYILHLINLIWNELEIASSIELMSISLKYNSTLTQELEYWRDIFLKIYNQDILPIMNKCDGQMEEYLKEDMRNCSNIKDMESLLTERYGNYELIGVILDTGDLFISNDANETGVHYTCIQSCDSGKKCVIYKKKDNNESAPTAVAKLIGRQKNFLKYFTTDGWYVIQSYRGLESEVDFYFNSSRFENYTQTMTVHFSETVLADDAVSEQTTCAGPYIHTMGASLVSLLAALLIGLMV
ncbi:uncharacterized protein LOC128236811 [Mya arenaria]|uniref:uncharacterized protein LOC128236811 n=1 Tax=Mya arenaria TaxID=6604 RepID=UPI0022E15152|nr:uncharacterized protein LOC128236811 [Mya arenaria]